MNSLVSCLCVSKNKLETVQHSLNTYMLQTYPQRELIFLYEDNNPHIKDIKQYFNDKSIRYIKIKYTIYNTLTLLRKKSLEYAKGDYIIQWDDDDVYHPRRIEVMYKFAQDNLAECVMIDSLLVYMEHKLFLFKYNFEGSLFAKKSTIEKYIYTIDNKIQKGEDTWLLKSLLDHNHIKFMCFPNSYIYMYHGNNVYTKQHFVASIKDSRFLTNIEIIHYESLFQTIEKLIGGEATYSKTNNMLHQLSQNIYRVLALKYPHNDILIYDRGITLSDEGLGIVYNLFKNLFFYETNPKRFTNKVIVNLHMPIYSQEQYIYTNINVIYTTYEFYPLPDKWCSILNSLYDIIIVPHIAIKDIFIKSGIIKPIYCIQQGYQPLPLYNNISNKKFIIGFNGVPVKRKNIDLLMLAINNLIKIYTDIVFKVHIPKYYQEITPIIFPSNQHYEISYGYKTQEELGRWYSSLSCYIFPSSGEGWSFTPRESLHLMIPTIISNCPVHKELEPFCKVIPLPITQSNIENCILDVYHNIDKYKKQAIQGSVYVKKYNNSENTISQVHRLLNKLSKKLNVFYLWGFNPEKDVLDKTIITVNEKFTNSVIISNVDYFIQLFSKENNIDMLWNSIPKWIIKTDIARLIYVYYNSGFYLDTDAIIVKDIILELNEDKEVYLFIESIIEDTTHLSKREKPYNTRIANYIFGTKNKKNPFIRRVILECIRRLNTLLKDNLDTVTQEDILWVCGPDVITTCYHEHKDSTIQLFNTEYIKHLAKGLWRDCLKEDIIPKKIWMTYKNNTIPEYCTSNWIKLNSGYSVHFFTDVDCLEFLEREFSTEYCELFTFLEDGPIKADFWRLCILYTYGGYYVDIDIEPIVSLDSFVENNIEFITCLTNDYNKVNFKDTWQGHGDKWNPHFIGVKKHSTLIKQCIDVYIQQFKTNKTYSYWDWSIVNIFARTLNGMYECIHNYTEGVYNYNGNRIQCIKESKPDRERQYCYYKNKTILYNHYKNYNNHEFQ